MECVTATGALLSHGNPGMVNFGSEKLGSNCYHFASVSCQRREPSLHHGGEFTNGRPLRLTHGTQLLLKCVALDAKAMLPAW